NLKSIGTIAKFTLLGLWLCSVIGLIIIGIKEASEHTFTERVIEKQTFQFKASDTLRIKMTENDVYNNRFHRNNSFKVANNEKGEKTIYSSDIEIIIRP